VGIPVTLIESELFGYVKGAFTGAKLEGKAGLFELANKGTLFLDEIGEIPLNIQSKLLRFLEKHEVNRVGGTEVRVIEVRIIAATNMNIEEMVSTKRFRADLYYRLNVVPIVIPPLRARRDDILSLLFYYMEKFNQKYQKEKTFSPTVIDILCDFDFPGNVRELSNLIERMVVTTEKSYLELSDLPQGIIKRIHQVDQENYGIYENLPLKEASEKFERIMIDRAIKKYGSQRKASRILTVDQATISRKLKKRHS
jgi:transcriptional regulator with PAS, ATPase and Fis domain